MLTLWLSSVAFGKEIEFVLYSASDDLKADTDITTDFIDLTSSHLESSWIDQVTVRLQGECLPAELSMV